MPKCAIDEKHKITPATSLRTYYCHDCKRWYDWPLKPGKKPIFDGLKRGNDEAKI